MQGTLTVVVIVLDGCVLVAWVFDGPPFDDPVPEGPLLDEPALVAPLLAEPVLAGPLLAGPVLDAPVLDAPVLDALFPGATLLGRPVFSGLDGPVLVAVGPFPLPEPTLEETQGYVEVTVSVTPLFVLMYTVLQTELSVLGLDPLVEPGWVAWLFDCPDAGEEPVFDAAADVSELTEEQGKVDVIN